MPLTDVTCRATKPGPKRRKLSDGCGLQLWIMPSGTRLWRFVYRYLGKQKNWAIGPYPKVSLTEARAQRDDARRLLRQGKDPIAERDQAIRAEQESLLRRRLGQRTSAGVASATKVSMPVASWSIQTEPRHQTEGMRLSRGSIGALSPASSSRVEKPIKTDTSNRY
jgi:hypothetical protein